MPHRRTLRRAAEAGKSLAGTVSDVAGAARRRVRARRADTPDEDLRIQAERERAREEAIEEQRREEIQRLIQEAREQGQQQGRQRVQEEFAERSGRVETEDRPGAVETLREGARGIGAAASRGAELLDDVVADEPGAGLFDAPREGRGAGPPVDESIEVLDDRVDRLERLHDDVGRSDRDAGTDFDDVLL